MSLRHRPPTRPSFPVTQWSIIALLIALLALSSCGLNSPAVNDAKTPITQAAQALSQCNQSAPGGCFSPGQVQTFYNLNPLYAQGFTGKGMTIVILESFGSPTIQQDLHVFDQTFGLPEPPSFDVHYPLGQVNFDASNRDQLSWARETTLDVEWAHAIAPGANIVLLVSPVSETEGVQGFPEFAQLSTYAMDHHLGQVFSMSFGASEPTLVGDPCNEHLGTGEALLKSYDQTVFQRAVTEHITMVASSGDWGATSLTCNPPNVYHFRAVSWPASDPLVTAVGGTKLSVKESTGTYGSERTWNEFRAASGGGLSQFYAQPDWQKQLPNQSALNGKRGLPDVSWGAANFPIYHSYPGRPARWSAGAGTSAGSPQWAGLIAIADQMAGKPLGFLNPALYQLAGKGFHDITTGNNSLEGIQGFQAETGWDLATGWGTPDAATLVPLLITAVQQTSA